MIIQDNWKPRYGNGLKKIKKENKMDNIKEEIQEFRLDNENLIKKIEVIDNNCEKVGGENGN